MRQRVLSHFLGLSDAADAFQLAFRIPNFLQNLLGEGVLSASFIPVYARLRAEGKDAEARDTANAVLGLLALTASLFVLAGMLLAAPLTTLLAPTWEGDKRELTIRLVRLLFPGAGLFVFSAWCLGVLNSHRRFLLSYAAPVLWNLAIILAVMLTGGGAGDSAVALAAAAGSVVGAALQVVVQLPTVIGLMGRLRPSIRAEAPPVRTVLRNFGPVFVGRGVVQISAFVDNLLAGLLGTGAVAALGNAQVLYTLPVSLFGMSVSAAELPAMSSATGTEQEIAAALRHRLDAGLRRIAYFVVPSAAAFLAFGGIIAGALFQTGKFTAADSTFVWAILAGSAVGLLAATMGRLYSSAYYALGDTRTPLRYAVLRVGLTILLGFLAAVPLPHLLGIDSKWGTAGLTASAGLAGWVEFFLLRRGLNRRIGETGAPPRLLLGLWAAALIGAGAAWGIGLMTGPMPRPLLQALVTLLPFGAVYLGLTVAAAVPEALVLVERLGRRARDPKA